MPVERTSRRIPATRLQRIARSLLDASTLCAIATVSAGGRAHVNTVYFAWTGALEIVWLSVPEARHSRNLRERRSVAVAVYDSTQRWGGRDRGIQLFGIARELTGRAARQAERAYADRFRGYGGDLAAYRLYRLRPREVKLFHERQLGGGTFVTARVRRGGRLEWVRTEEYESS